MIAKRIKQNIKAMLRSIAPQFAEAWQARRSERHCQRVMRASGVDAVIQKYIASYDRVVKRGPFAGLTLQSSALGSALLPKLLGSYEQELHATIHKALQQRYELVLDVGAAEGYYAVGLAKFLHNPCPVIAYDLNVSSRSACMDLARLNGAIDRIQWRQRCEPQSLEQLGSRRALLICDCEGFEAELFSAQTLPFLTRTDLIVELHESPAPGVTPILQKLFQATHRVELVPVMQRDTEDYPELGSYTPEEQRVAVSEFRGQTQNWLVAWARQ